MSLLNDVMRDLQTRGVLGVPPLSGLAPVADVPSQRRRRGLLLPVLAAVVVVAAITLWRPVSDGGWMPLIARITGDAATEPQSGLQVDAQTSPQSEPALAATGDDLRELFSIDRSGTGALAPYDNIVEAPVADATPGSAVLAEPPVAETLPAVQAPPTESRPVAESPVAESPIVAEPQTMAVEPAKTATMRIEPRADDPEEIVARGLKAMRGNDLITAERFFRKALAIESGDAEVWTYLYSVLSRTARPAAAEQALQQGLAAADERASLAKLYARMLLDRGDRDAAVSILRIHRPAPASDTEYDAFLAALLQQQGQYKEAGEIYGKLVTVDPGSGSAWIGLAMSHDSLGDTTAALSAFESALRTGSMKTPLARYARRRSTELKADD